MKAKYTQIRSGARFTFEDRMWSFDPTTFIFFNFVKKTNMQGKSSCYLRLLHHSYLLIS